MVPIATAAATLMVLAGLFGIVLAHPGSVHWVFFHGVVRWCMAQSQALGVPLLIAGLVALGTDWAIRAGRVPDPWDHLACYGQIAAAGVTAVPVALFLALMAITVAVWTLLVVGLMMLVVGALAAMAGG